MITRPTTAQLLEVVRRELAERVAPAVADRQVATSLQMVDHILSALAVRADHELGWMAEEMTAVEAVGERVAASGLPGAQSVAEALSVFRAGRPTGLHAAAVVEDYNRASEVLSRAVEATFGQEGELREAVVALLDQRLAHEIEVIGPDFQLVGRT
jgi:hypothetical protein